MENGIAGIVNIGSGEGIALEDLIESISKKMGHDELIRLGTLTYPPNDPPILVANIKRLTKEVGWTRSISTLDLIEAFSGGKVY